MEYLEILLSCAVLLSTLFTGFLLILPSQYKEHGQTSTTSRGLDPKSKKSDRTNTKPPPTPFQIVVLGDIGRSPRMQYHALSIAKHGGKVDVIGYLESDVHPDITATENIQIIPITPVPKRFQASSKLLFLVLGPLKVLLQAWYLYSALAYSTKPAKWVLVQNPPSIPTLAVALFVCFFRNSNLVVDWHNFGYSILAMKLGTRHPLVQVSQIYETLLAKYATSHFCVTKSMGRYLKKTSGIDPLTLHDRPPAIFKPLSRSERQNVLKRLPQTSPFEDEIDSGRTRLIVSSTSWTADEDFSILLDALTVYSLRASMVGSYPRLLVMVTGKGPLKDHYLSKIKELESQGKLHHVQIRTAWLSAEDYASLLGAADLGVSLHMSSSGLDLPMKVVDMFGAGLPVAGWSKFEAWPELVREGVNGRGFASYIQLADLLEELFVDGTAALERIQQGALKECEKRWDAEWDAVAGRYFGLLT
ncbi:chitobiosyldiphosphodolichol beta-mannosyltransferase [Eremomyces bilateralis CBS 781.70]|uniref:Chitobiosyldiphosphodolichol beta-mannosyltransferase n=1 Tax=Eremomyces bilateralis CBS 781.70 TaxID=1392243 RepID=A0A6G1GDQ5_9PEZI|nr:chitobiosyldiphosphodolichol beta-mannosyltransferase [Eremomyces bilateralis CBS 781.70]KAF1816036.1 chitobiosyldiphosphodolichol beta-mannosyltransferase [Eremomyces bilateralis CBS 781.70]